MNMGPDASGGGMAGMDMGGATPASNKAGDALLPSFRPWGLNDFAFIFTMWAVMMVGMMTPSATPMVLLYAMVGRSAATGGRPFAATGWFFAGYIAVWIGFSAAATLAQWTLVRLALLSPIMAATDKAVGGVILIVAGIYQWTPLKAVCLRACQGPLAFIMGLGGFRSSAFGAMQLGAKHGLYCLGCCWALMALLFVGGVMNLIWIAGLAILILLEKTLPATGLWIPRISGVVLAIAGAWLLVGAPQLA
jgi:predicted metal-binding membrane protein